MATSQAAYMAGKFAIIFLGLASDTFGRRFVALLCILGSFVSRAITAVAPNFPVFAIGRFLVSAFALGEYTALYVLGKKGL